MQQYTPLSKYVNDDFFHQIRNKRFCHKALSPLSPTTSLVCYSNLYTLSIIIHLFEMISIFSDISYSLEIWRLKMCKVQLMFSQKFKFCKDSVRIISVCTCILVRVCKTCFSHYHILLVLLQFKWILPHLIPL